MTNPITPPADDSRDDPPSPHATAAEPAETPAPEPHPADGHDSEPHAAAGQMTEPRPDDGSTTEPHPADGRDPEPDAAEGLVPEPPPADGSGPEPRGAEAPGSQVDGGRARGGRWIEAWPWVVAGAVGVVSLVLRLRSPAWLVEAPNDDVLFARLAQHVVDGDWLGPYDKLTLVKGPGYPLFMAAVHDLGLPLKLAEHLVHLVACAITGWAVARVFRSRGAGLAAFAVLALNPAYLGTAAARVARDSLYGSLCLLVFGGCLLLVSFVPALAARGPRWAVPVAVAGGAALGVAAAGYYLTREERAWLAPAVVLVVLAGVVSWPRRDRFTRRNLVVALTLAAAAAVGCLGALHWTAEQNREHYGTTVLADMADGEIARAYAEWQRVQVGRERRYVPVSTSQRRAVYRVSPAAAEMEEAFTGEATAWVGLSCAFAGVCDDYMGSFFVWAMRDAAEAAGHADSGAESQRYFGRVADDIAEACDTGELRCSAPPLGPLPPWHRIDGDDLWASTWDVTGVFLAYDVGEPEHPPSVDASPAVWRTLAAPIRGIDDRADHVARERAALDTQWPVSALTDVYRPAARLGVVVALAGLLAGLATRAGRRNPAALLLVAALLVATLTRIMLLALVDATAWPAAGQLNYVLPATDYLVLFVLLGCWTLATAVRGSVRQHRDREPGIPAEVHRPGDGPRPEPLPHRVEGVVEGVPVAAAEGKGELDRPVVGQVADRHAHQREPARLDHRRRPPQQPPHGGQDRRRVGRRLRPACATATPG